MTSEFLALIWTTKLISIALLLQTLEMFRIQKTFSDAGIWQWRTLALDWNSSPKGVQLLLNGLLSASNFKILLWARLCAAVITFVYPDPILILVLLFSTVLVGLRWRGVFNGGSDYMSVAILIGLLIASSLKDFPQGTLAGLGYIAFQTVLSYFLSGTAKIRQKGWRDGSSLQKMVGRQWTGAFARFSSWMVLLFELSFPLALFNTKFAIFFITVGSLFHLTNFFFFGLNRFFWVWLATYPALYYCSSQFN